MTRPHTVSTTAPRPSRILILLAAAWLVAAMTIGGLSLGSSAQAAEPETTTSVAQP